MSTWESPITFSSVGSTGSPGSEMRFHPGWRSMRYGGRSASGEPCAWSSPAETAAASARSASVVRVRRVMGRVYQPPPHSSVTLPPLSAQGQSRCKRPSSSSWCSSLSSPADRQLRPPLPLPCSPQRRPLLPLSGSPRRRPRWRFQRHSSYRRPRPWTLLPRHQPAPPLQLLHQPAPPLQLLHQPAPPLPPLSLWTGHS